MTAFAELDWRRIDVHAIVADGGLGVIDPARHRACHNWLKAHGYAVESVDFSDGIGPVVELLGTRLRWEEQFGYRLEASSRNLDALRDGFCGFEAPEAEGLVVEVLEAEAAWREDPAWFMGFVAIIREHSREQLALGKRFFGLLVLEGNSPLIGAPIDQSVVPGPFWQVSRAAHEFEV